jgi:aspartokinase
MAEKIRLGGVIQNDHLASISVLAYPDRPGIAAVVLGALGQKSLNVQFVVQMIDHQACGQIVLCVDRGDLQASLAAIEALRPEVRPAAVLSNPAVASIAIFGPDFRERPGIAGRMFAALAQLGINILAISTSISTVNCIVESGNLRDAYAAICDCFEVP